MFTEPHDQVALILLGLTALFIAAKAGAFLAQRFQQPAVLGELIAGVAPFLRGWYANTLIMSGRRA